MRQSRSQTDEELNGEENGCHNGCTLCKEKLQLIKAKLDQGLLLLPELEQQKVKIASLEESLEFMQKKVKDLKETLERSFVTKEMKIPREGLDDINFERVQAPTYLKLMSQIIRKDNS